MPLQQTSGNVTQDAYGGGKAVVPTYVENVFSTYLYTGTGATQNINNGIAESTSGALTWIKTRSAGSYSNVLFDTVQGAGNYLISNNTYGQNYLGAAPDSLSSFNSNGFSLGADTQLGYVNLTGNTYASWTFRKQPKFFDIQTWTGTGSAMTISHNLQSVPGCIIVKRTDSLSQWYTYHQSLNGGVNPEQYYVNLCATSPQAGPGATLWNGTPPTSTVFSVNGAETCLLYTSPSPRD